MALVFAANTFALAYVSAERYFYYWDWAMYWLGFQQLGELFRHSPLAAIGYLSRSIRTDDYNLLPIFPLVPFEILGGPNRTSYILAITNLGVLPSAALMALVAQTQAEHRSWARVLLSTAVLLALHPLWAPALRGMPDVLGVVVACAILLTYFARPVEDQRPSDSIRLGILLCLLILTRRWYLFWAASFFPAAFLAYLAAPPRGLIDRRGLLSMTRALALAGFTCLLFLLILAAPVAARVASSDYRAAFTAYRSGLGAGGQLAAQFGPALLALAAAGLCYLASKPRTRALAVLLIVQAAASMLLFTHVQSFLGVQHYYLVVPAVGIGVAGAIDAAADWRVSRIWRGVGLGGIIAVVLLSSVRVLAPSPMLASALLPSLSYPPLVRTDVGEVHRLLDRLAQLKPRRVYVLASSDVLNWSILKMASLEHHSELWPTIAITHDIDSRDGFPDELPDVDYVVLATPTQYHVQPEEQRVVGLLARDVRSGRGVGASFTPLPGDFHLERGVEVQIYRRTAPLRPADLQALRDELLRSHPGMTIARPPA